MRLWTKLKVGTQFGVDSTSILMNEQTSASISETESLLSHTGLHNMELTGWALWSSVVLKQGIRGEIFRHIVIPEGLTNDEKSSLIYHE